MRIRAISSIVRSSQRPLAAAGLVCSYIRWQRKSKAKQDLHAIFPPDLTFCNNKIIIWHVTVTSTSSVASPSTTTRRHTYQNQNKRHVGN